MASNEIQKSGSEIIFLHKLVAGSTQLFAGIGETHFLVDSSMQTPSTTPSQKLVGSFFTHCNEFVEISEQNPFEFLQF